VTLALRCFSLAFLGWHLGLLFPGLGDPAFVAAAGVVGLVGGAWVRRLRWWLALPLGALVFSLGPLILTVVPSWITGPTPSPLDDLPLWADRQLTLALAPFALGWVEGWAFTGRPHGRGWERLLHAAAVVALFWSQGPYHVTLYPHPLGLALAFGLFLASELTLLTGRTTRMGSWVAAVLVGVLGVALLWTLLGRYEDQAIASGGGLMKPDLFQFDFAPLVRLEDEITLGENLVLLYREEGTPRVRYLRRLVLDAYDPANGFSTQGAGGPTVGRRVRTLGPGGIEERNPITQEYYLVNIDPSSLLSLNDPVKVTPYAQWNHSSFVNAYRVDSLVAADAIWLYNEQMTDGLTPEQRAFYTQGGGDPEIRALALAWTKGTKTPYEKANAILQTLRDQYYYSLKPGSPGPRGALKHFLFEGKKGYCSYFAFSMTLMLRSLGIPARIAVGFATDPSKTVLGFTPVRAFQAHAWVEVPFGPYGWLEFDPTSEKLAPGETFQFPKDSDPQELSKMIAEILDAKPQPLADPAPTAQGSDRRIPWELVWSAGTSALPWALPLLLLVLNEGWRHRWRWMRFRAQDDRRRVAGFWAEVAWRARRSGRGPRPGETPEAWARRRPLGPPEADPDPVLAFAQTVSQARYAPEPTPALVPLARGQAQVLGHGFDASRPRIHRWMGTLFPWWPR